MGIWTMKALPRGPYQPLQHRKKLFYVISSLLLAVALLCTGVLDLLFLLVAQRPDLTTHKSVTTIMVSYDIDTIIIIR